MPCPPLGPRLAATDSDSHGTDCTSCAKAAGVEPFRGVASAKLRNPWPPLALPPPPEPWPTTCCLQAARPDEQADGRSLTADYDKLGFLVPASGDALGESCHNYEEWFAPKAERRRNRLQARQCQLSSPGEWSTVPRSTLKALLRKGLPAEHRSEVWWSVLGCNVKQQEAPGMYQQRLNEELLSNTRDEIERDLQRTFPTNRTFRTEAGRSKLRSVLHAYACHCPQIGYCQGMNFIAALLLLVFLDEERTFWALACAMDKLGVEGYYAEGMTLLQADMRVLFRVLAQKCPKVSKVLQDEGADLSPLCSEWYLTWFAKCLPIQTTLRVWDAFFLEGSKVLVRVAIGVFKTAEPQILGDPTFEEIMANAKKWPGSLVEHNELLKVSFRGIPQLRRRDLLEARERALGDLVQEQEAHKRRIDENKRLCALRDEERRKKAKDAEAALQPITDRFGADALAAMPSAAPNLTPVIGLCGAAVAA